MFQPKFKQDSIAHQIDQLSISTNNRINEIEQKICDMEENKSITYGYGKPDFFIDNQCQDNLYIDVCNESIYYNDECGWNSICLNKKGYRGLDGIPGSVGLTGPTGPNGLTGSTGPAGTINTAETVRPTFRQLNLPNPLIVTLKNGTYNIFYKFFVNLSNLGPINVTVYVDSNTPSSDTQPISQNGISQVEGVLQTNVSNANLNIESNITIGFMTSDNTASISNVELFFVKIT